MLHRIAHMLLVGAVASSGVSAPFLHVHAHGSHFGVSSHGEGVDEHCAHHHAEGAHWHVADGRVPGADELAGAAPGHRHAAVTLSAVAIGASSVCLDASVAPLATPEADPPPASRGAHTHVDSTAGPDPPPRAVNAARAPPARS